VAIGQKGIVRVGGEVEGAGIGGMSVKKKRFNRGHVRGGKKGRRPRNGKYRLSSLKSTSLQINYGKRRTRGTGGGKQRRQ